MSLELSDEKLQSLLACKRLAQPPQGALDNVVGEFHRRLRHEEIRRRQNSPAALWGRLMDALLVEPLYLLRNTVGAAALAAGLMLGFAAVSVTHPTPDAGQLAQNTLRIDLEPVGEAAIAPLALAAKTAAAGELSIGAFAEGDFGRQMAQPALPETPAQAAPVSFDEANIIF
jgi:hypothetical protein